MNNCLFTDARLHLLELRIERIERRQRAEMALRGLDLVDLDVLLRSGDFYLASLKREDVPGFTQLLHVATEAAAVVGQDDDVISIDGYPFGLSMASYRNGTGQDWRGLITYSGWQKPLAFSSRLDLQDVQQALVDLATSEQR